MSARPSPASAAVTVAFWMVVALTMPLLLVVAVLLFAVTAPFDPDRRVLHAFVCRSCHAYLRVNPLWRVRVEGRALACLLVRTYE